MSLEGCLNTGLSRLRKWVRVHVPPPTYGHGIQSFLGLLFLARGWVVDVNKTFGFFRAKVQTPRDNFSRNIDSYNFWLTKTFSANNII
jgi:hypothetical protein